MDKEKKHEIEVSIVAFGRMLDKIQKWVHSAAMADDYTFAVECQKLIDICIESFQVHSVDSDIITLEATDEVLEKLLILLIYTVSADEKREEKESNEEIFIT